MIIKEPPENNTIGHVWVYDKTSTRTCSQCHMKEWFDQNENKWKWIATDEFMNNDIIHEDSP